MTGREGRSELSHGLARLKYNMAQATRAYVTLSTFVIFAFFLGFGSWYYARFEGPDLQNASMYGLAKICVMAGCPSTRFPLTYEGEGYLTPAAEVVEWAGAKKPGERAIRHLPFAGMSGVAFGFLVGFGLFRTARAAARRDTHQHVRGNDIVEDSELRALIAKRKVASDMTIGNVPLIKDTERQGYIGVGTVGAGKSTVIYKMLDRIEKRGEMAVVVDDNGEFVARYYNPDRGDVLLNPFDARAPRWSPWSEIRNGWRDCERIAAATIPPGDGKGKFFHDAARMVLASILFRLPDHKGGRSIEELTRQILVTSREDKLRLVRGTPAAQLFEEGAEGPGQSVDITVSIYASKLGQLYADAGLDLQSDFSIFNFITGVDERKKPQPWLFLNSRKADLATMRPLLTMWMESVALAILSMPKSRERIIHIVADEFGQLMHIPSFPDLLAEGRGFGSAPKLGVQSPYQIKERYGPDGAKTLMNVLNTSAVFRMLEASAANEMASMFGAAEIDRDSSNIAFDGPDVKSRSSSIRRTIEQTVLPSELMQLNDLECYVRLPGGYPIAKTRLIHPGKKARREQCPAFTEVAPGLSGAEAVLNAVGGGASRQNVQAVMSADEKAAKDIVDTVAVRAREEGGDSDMDDLIARMSGRLRSKKKDRGAAAAAEQAGADAGAEAADAPAL